MIEYRTEAGSVRADMIDGFFVGWPTPPSADTLVAVMDGSYRRVWAIEDGRVVGYINAISDGVLNAFLPWLEHLGFTGPAGAGRRTPAALRRPRSEAATA